MSGERRLVIAIREEWDVSLCLAQVGEIARECGMREEAVAMVLTATSELARNILRYAGHGSVSAAAIEKDGRHGIEIVASDRGPGIADPELAMQDHFSTGGTLGLGLPAAQRMMDEFDLVTEPGHGTEVIARKWA